MLNNMYTQDADNQS